MKSLAFFFKGLVILAVILLVAGMMFMKRDVIWRQTKVARAFYYVWQGDENIKKDNFQAAIDNYKIALKIYPEHSKAHYNLGNIYFWYELYTASPIKQPVKTFRYNKDLDKFVLHIEDPKAEEDPENSAEAAYMKATEVNPNYINAWINLGLVRFKKYDIDGAIIAFMKAINADPEIVEIPFIYNNKKNVDYNRSVAYFNLANVYGQMATSTDYEELRNSYLLQAMHYYEKSLKINKNSYKTNYNLATTLQLLNRESPSINQYCKAIKINPFKFSAHYNLGLVLKKQERYLAASSEIKKAAMLIDAGGDNHKSEFLFRILNDVSFRAAASELSRLERMKTELYPIPKKGIIAEVIGKPLLAQQEELKLKQQKEEEKVDESIGKQTVEQYFSSCVTDPDYYDALKEKYELQPDWIYVSKELIQQITELSQDL